MNDNQNSKEKLLSQMREADEKNTLSTDEIENSNKSKLKSSFWIKSAVISIIIVLVAFGIYYFNFIK